MKKKERNIKELLQVMLDNTRLFRDGLCNYVQLLQSGLLLDLHEVKMLLVYIEYNRPSKWSSFNAYRNCNILFYWDMGDIKPRIKWIKKHIKKVS